MFASEKLKGHKIARILDVACGVGYGSKYLAEEIGVEVIAVDRDSHALEIAAKMFEHHAVTFVEGDCHELGMTKKLGSSDAVVSFETLEHLPRPHEFLSRLRKILTDQGILVMSTPNISANSTGKIENEYHEREYTATEFVSILHEAGFHNVDLYGQYFTALGLLRNDIRAELNKITSNPFHRLGRWLQKVLKGHYFDTLILPEDVADFEIVPLLSAENCDALGNRGPFALIAVAHL